MIASCIMKKQVVLQSFSGLNANENKNKREASVRPL